MRNKNSYKFVHQKEGDIKETMARQSRECPKKCNMEDLKKTTSGRNPEIYSVWRERHSRSCRHRVWEAFRERPETTAETPPFTWALQVKDDNSKKKTFIKCPPVTATHKTPRPSWEGKPMMVMKIIKKTRCRPYKDTPPKGSSVSPSSTETEIPVDSGLVSGSPERHQSEDRETDAANEMETTKIWTSQVTLTEDSSETAETKQTAEEEKEENKVCGTKVELLQTEEKADEQRNEKDMEVHGDSGTCEQLEDRNEDVIIENSRSETERCKQELQEEAAENTKIIHQLEEEMNTLEVNKQNSEARVQQLEDGPQLSKDYDSSNEKVQQLDEDEANMSSFKTSAEKREQTEQRQISVSKYKDLLDQIENIRTKEKRRQLRPQKRLLQKQKQMEDVPQASKTSKETKAETREAGEKKRWKWVRRIFFGKSKKKEKEAKKAEEARVPEEAAEKRSRNCFINMFQTAFSSMNKKTCGTF